MSAPSGPGRSRANSRSRGSTRGVTGGGTGRGRDARNGIPAGYIGRRQTPGVGTGAETQKRLKARPKRDQVYNKTWRNPAHLSSAKTEHEGRLPGSRNETWRNAASEDSSTYQKRMNDLYQTLKDDRERERKEAIRNGFLADPDKPTSLANAITPVGTCEEMCPEFERVERIVQQMVDGSEKETSISGKRVPCEALMVKRFRRSAAGYDEQLPSDIRPPAILKKTLDYLFNDVVGGPEPLASVHKFVWDRTRGIRNDFSIQQVTKLEDLRIAIDCFERIARFHILSLHQLSRTDLKDNEFDHHQEREQLINTLLSLMYYYDDSRHKLVSPNEAEFRAYCIIFEIQDQRPDLEDRAQNWPRHILNDPRVQIALRLYWAAVNTSDEQGPLRPRTPFSIAQANTGGFWRLIRSNSVSYLTACVAEIYFNLVRDTALEAIWKAYKGKRGGSIKMEDWVLQDLTIALGFDEEDQTAQFCEDHDFAIEDNDNGNAYIDLASVTGGQLRDSSTRRKQVFSKTLVEPKRLGRTLPAVINGLTASQAQSQGFVEDSSDADSGSSANHESLFIDGDSDEDSTKRRSRSGSPLRNEIKNDPAPLISTATTNKPTTTFGQPSSKPNPFQPNPLTQSQGQPLSIFASDPTTQPKSNPFAAKEAPKFNPFQPRVGDSSTANPGGTPKFNFFPDNDGMDTAESAPPSNQPITISQAPQLTRTFGPSSSSLGGNASISDSGDMSAKGPSFHSSTQLVPPQSTTKPKSEGNDTRPKVSHAETSSEVPQNKAPSFSFGTSPLFQIQTSNASKNSVPSLECEQSKSVLPEVDDTVWKDSFFNTPIQKPSQSESVLQAPAITGSSSISTPIPGALFPTAISSDQSSANSPTNSHINEKPLTQGFSSPPLQAPTNISSPGKTPCSAAAQEPMGPESSARVTTLSTASAAANISNSTSFPKPPLTSLSVESSRKVTRPDSRPLALDKLAQILMTEEGGLLQQFVEFTIAPIIRSSLIRFEDEKSWARARECRLYLLAKKFFQKWKLNAWSLGLRRRGKERRRHLAQSKREKALSPSPKPPVTGESPFPKTISKPRELDARNAISDMPPPPSTTQQKRQSLPAQSTYGLNHATDTNDTLPSNKRKRDDGDSDLAIESNSPNEQRQTHKRSSTVAGPIMSAPPHRAPRTHFRTSVNPSRIGDGSLLGDTLMRQARRLAPNARSDTTRTAYFKLKAMGLDPDTPIVPETKKRPRATTDANGRREVNGEPSSRSNDIRSLAVQNPIANSSAADDDDDDNAFFDSIRAVRETLADSTSWFQQERQSLERSMTPHTSSSPPNSETPAERRLRELREKSHTPSRSELRLRAMGDSPLLPKGFWDGRGMGLSLYGKGKEHETAEGIRIETPMQPRRMGFVALSQQRQVNGMVNGHVRGESRRSSQPLADKGSSAEDAIEL